MRPFGMIALLALVGCGDDFTPNDDYHVPPSSAAAAFVAQEPLPTFQYTAQIFDWNGIEVFTAHYGEGQDCPSGCIYSVATGLGFAGRTGWLGFADVHGYAPDSTRFYDFVATDTALFDADTWFVLMTANWWACFDMLLPALAHDEETDRAAFLAMATILYTHESRRLAELVVDNPAIAADAEILGILAALPVVRDDIYADARARAQLLLDGLGR